jgi:hypothetical protein
MYRRFGLRFPSIVVLIGAILAGSIIFYLTTRYSTNLGLKYSDGHANIHWGETTYSMDREETLEHGEQINFMNEKFISIIDGTQRFRAFKIRGISEREWMMVFSQDEGLWFSYRRGGVGGDFPNNE